MVTSQVIHLNRRGTPKDAFPQAIMAGDFMYLSGILPVDRATGEVLDASHESQLKRIFSNMSAILSTQALGLDNLVKITLYLSSELGLKSRDDMANVDRMLAEVFGVRLPTKTLVFVDYLPEGILACVDGIAYVERD
jgi:2-iminobutanoate/2-iminopropanoate deaminase